MRALRNAVRTDDVRGRQGVRHEWSPTRRARPGIGCLSPRRRRVVACCAAPCRRPQTYVSPTSGHVQGKSRTRPGQARDPTSMRPPGGPRHHAPGGNRHRSILVAPTHTPTTSAISRYKGSAIRQPYEVRHRDAGGGVPPSQLQQPHWPFAGRDAHRVQQLSDKVALSPSTHNH